MKYEYIMKFALQKLEMNDPREDYREPLALTVIFLGGVPPPRISFRALGILHHARWTFKAFFYLKIFVLVWSSLYRQ